ncbi:hypothetical protein KAR91_61235 [Candidatus Pacearchaeota archaeon]|nr:hypothetical protein [Candidatus Pacearchaeota archaeon]
MFNQETRFVNIGMYYRNGPVKYLTPGVPPSIAEPEKYLRDMMFPNIWEGLE